MENICFPLIRTQWVGERNTLGMILNMIDDLSFIHGRVNVCTEK